MLAQKVENTEDNGLRVTKTAKVAIVETGMLGGVILAAYTLPDITPLKLFLTASAAVFLLGNLLLFRTLRGKPEGRISKDGAWPHIIRALLILAVCWLVILVLHRN